MAKMKIIILLSVIYLTSATNEKCLACIHGFCYTEQRLANLDVYDADVDLSKNIVYVAGRSGYDPNYLYQCDLKTLECKLKSQTYMADIAVDQNTGVLYCSSNNTRLCKFDEGFEELTTDIARDVRVRDKVYHKLVGKSGLYVLNNQSSDIVEGTENQRIDLFIIDANNDVYFTRYNDYNLKYDKVFRVSNGVLSLVPVNVSLVHLTLDSDGNAVLIDFLTNVVYRVKGGVVETIGGVDFMMRNVLFDRYNNMITFRGLLFPAINFMKKTDVRCRTFQEENKWRVTIEPIGI